MQVRHAEPSQQTLVQAVELLRSGGLVALPTETVYGIAASAASDRGFERLRSFKDRPADRPLTLHLPDPTAAERYIGLPHPFVARLIAKTFPGPVTLIVDVDPEPLTDQLQAFGLSPQAHQRLYYQNTIGLRCPDSSITRQILRAIDEPVVASSANARGKPPPHDAADAADAVGDAVDLVVDGGRCRYAKPSTVVRVSHDNKLPTLQIDRVGVYDERFIRKLISWTLVVVCSGNTCRSPMAGAIAKQLLASMLTVPVDYLPKLEIRVESAGVFATDGSSASPEAVEEMSKIGIDLSGHRSKHLSSDMIRRADLCCCMTAAHQQAAVELVPEAAQKIVLLDANGDVEDPIGLGSTAYRHCAELIRQRLTERLKEHYP